MSTTKPNLKRQKTLKVPLNDPEDAAIRQFCGGQVAPFVRGLLLAHIRAEANRNAEQRRTGRPRHGHPHGHQQRFPGRVAAGCHRRLHL